MIDLFKLSFPFTEDKMGALKVGDEELISGVAFTRVTRAVSGEIET
jgi:hypothetical protein